MSALSWMDGLWKLCSDQWAANSIIPSRSLSPTFTAFFPLFYLGIAGTYHDRAFHGICLWFLMTFFFEALPFTSHLWRNWSWRSEPRLDWENQIVVVTGVRPFFLNVWCVRV